MKRFFDFLAHAFQYGIGYFLAMVFSALTVGSIVYAGSEYSIEWIFSKMYSMFSGTNPQEFQYLRLVASNLYLDQFLSIIFSAYAASLALVSFQSLTKIGSTVVNNSGES